jgi:hypothetical protein
LPVLIVGPSQYLLLPSLEPNPNEIMEPSKIEFNKIEKKNKKIKKISKKLNHKIRKLICSAGSILPRGRFNSKGT